MSRRASSDLTQEERQNLTEAFRAFDDDQDGNLDFHELRLAMKALGFDPEKKEVLRILRENDSTRRGLINELRFKDVVGKMMAERDPKDQLRAAFALFDIEGNGKITLDDLRQTAQDVGEAISDEDLRAMIETFDLDDDGAISQEEFMAIFSKRFNERF